MNQKKNIFLLFVSILFYTYIMFFSEISLGTGKKELENLIILVIPCIIYLMQSFKILNFEDRKKYIYYYLVIYILVIVSFTFSNFRLIYRQIGDVNFVREYNLIPFNSIKELLTNSLGVKTGLYNIVGNLLMLMPLAVLLPLINDKFKRKRYFISLMFVISFGIEILQYVTNCGSFDVDDIILNFIGVVLVYLIIINSQVYDLIYKIFYKVVIKAKFIKYINVLLYFILIFIYILYVLNIYQLYKDNRVDYSNLICKDNIKTYITTYGAYDYYSECNYSGYVLKGSGQKIMLKDYLGFDISDKVLSNLKITKEKWLESIEIDYNDGILRKINDDGRTKTYLLGIDEIKIKSNKSDDMIIIGAKGVGNFNYFTLVDMIEMSSDYVIYSGEYYDVVGCSKKLSLDANNYIISKRYVYNSNFCNMIEELK